MFNGLVLENGMALVFLAGVFTFLCSTLFADAP